MKGARAPLSRSEVMARVKGRDTRPEIRLRKVLHAAGLRYRLHAKELPGRPDVVFRRAKMAIFVHGCFWHRHPRCEHARMPKSRVEFWTDKLNGNVERDSRQLAALEAAGWTVLIVWECETRDPGALNRIVKRVLDCLKATKANV